MEWISVKDRLPEEYESVLAATRFVGDGGWEVEVLRWTGWKWEDEVGGQYAGGAETTHWMPLPPPPMVSPTTGSECEVGK